MKKGHPKEVVYGEGGEYIEDDDLWSDVKATDQAAAEFLLVLDEIEPAALDQIRMLVQALPRQFTSFAHDRELAWLLANDLETKISTYPGTPNYEKERKISLQIRYTDYQYKVEALLEGEYHNLMTELPEEILEHLANWICTFRLWSRPVVQLVILTLADWKRLELKNEEPKGGRWGQRVDVYADPDRNKNYKELNFPSFGTVPSLSSNHDLEFKMERAWDPFQELWRTAGPRIRAAFEENLEEYRLRVAKLAEAEGGKKAPRKRSAREHFQWLVYYQTAGMSYQTIINQNAQGARNDRKTIIGGIESAADLIELILREPGRGGRLKGRKDSQSGRRRVSKK